MAKADALALLAIARRDLLAAQGMGDAAVFHEAVWGFQVQQAIEKALKAWLYLLEKDPPFTHDLVALFKLLDRAGVDISAFRELAASPTLQCRSATTINPIFRTWIGWFGTAKSKLW